MLSWLALCLPTCPASPAEAPHVEPPSGGALPQPDLPKAALSQQHALGCWALQFTPRVTLFEEAVLMEVHASQRLFGGAQALRERLTQEAASMGCTAMACAPTSLAALALARSSPPRPEGLRPDEGPALIDGWRQPLPRLLDRLPLGTLRIVAEHQSVLSRLGCRTLGDVRRLPRGGLNRRFVAGLLATLDQAYGEQPESHDWLPLPDAFQARLELPGRVDTAPAMMVGAERLLLQMAGWLAARRAGVRRFTLSWLHDALRPRHVQAHGHLSIHTAEITRHVDHLARLLSEHLARVQLEAPVGDLILQADEVEPLADLTPSLLLDDSQRREPLHELLERLAARLGADRVRRPVLVSDHRIERMQRWQSAADPLPRPDSANSSNAVVDPGPQPSWLLPRPLRLAVRQHKPIYQGTLQLMAGPHRIEAGWWDRHDTQALRDYHVALSPQAGLLWIYRERMPSDEGDGDWFLHGLFA